MTDPVTEPLTSSDALALAELLAAYVTETRRGAPRRPDQLYVERLLAEAKVEALGTKIDGQLVGYALFFDLPDTATGRRIGYFEDLYVSIEHRRKGLASALLEALRKLGLQRGWLEIRWTAPQGGAAGRAFSGAKGEPARGESFRLVLNPEEPEGKDAPAPG